jgi:hypothetical protein
MASAQISITDGDVFGLIGTSDAFEIDTTFSVMVDIGMPGANQTWDFRNLQILGVFGSADFISPAGTPFETSFPDANFVEKMQWNADDTTSFEFYSYIRVTSSQLSTLGLGTVFGDTLFTVSKSEDVAPLPLVFGTSWQSFESDTSTFSPEFFTVTNDTSVNTVDGWGTVRLPIGDFACLRLKTESSITSTTYVEGSPFQSSTYMSTSYTWLNKNHFFVMSIDIEEDAPFSGGSTDITAPAQLVEATSVIRLTDMSTGVAGETTTVPSQFVLAQNYPNPFNPETVIKFEVAADMPVELTLSNLLGQRIRTLATGVHAAGQHAVSWNGTDDAGQQMPSGMYIYQLRAGNVVQTRRMLLLR